jgi:NAD(P)-dependent dehydrogenase (short-subunit alcohol dehydrogenase family)
VKQVGHTDVLALSAAAAPSEHPLAQMPLSEMEISYNTNVLGNWNLVKAVLNARTSRERQTTIINVSSWAAYRPISGQAVYGSSKAAFAQLVTEWAKEFDEKEVRFVSYHPGAIYTEMASEHFPKEVFEGWESVVLPGQFAVWLASPEADFLNGRFVWAQWDVDQLIQAKEKILNDPYFLKISLVQ